MATHPAIYQHPELSGKTIYMEGEKGKKQGLLFIHGFTATTVEVRQITNYFNVIGYTVSAPLLPGHGTTPEDLNHQSWKDWTIAVDESFSKLSQEFSEICVFGESMGALLSLWLANKHHEINNVFLFSPALKIDGLWMSLFTWPFTSYVFKKNTDESMQWQGYNVVPLRAAAQLFRLQKMIKKLLPKIKTNILIFQGKKDQTINTNGTIETFNLLGSKNKELIWLDNSSHCILLDVDLLFVEEKCLNVLIDRG